MKRSEFPMEKFELAFAEYPWSNPVEAKLRLVTIMRFLTNEIGPKVADFVETLPGVHEIANTPLRNLTEGLELLAKKKMIGEFRNKTERHFEDFFAKSSESFDLSSIQEVEVEKVNSIIEHMVNRHLAPLELIKLTIDQKFDSFVNSVAGPVDLDDECSDLERTVAEAGEKFNVPVTSLMRR